MTRSICHAMKRTAAALFATVAIAGCARFDPQAAVVAERQIDYKMEMNSVYLLDPALKRDFTVEANGARRSPTNTLEAYITLRSRVDQPARLIARARFFDAQKRPLEESQWSTLFLDRRGLKDYAVLSTKSDATFYLIEVQYSR